MIAAYMRESTVMQDIDTQRRLIQTGFERKQLEILSSIMQDSLAESLREFDKQSRIGPVDIYPHMMKITFGMVGRSLFGARLKEEDIELISLAISTVQEFMVRQTIQPYLNPWFAVSGELRRHEEMRARALSFSDVPKFEFTTQVILEALRLYPPFWMVDRIALADDRAGDLEIPRGSTVVVFIYGAHHSPQYWENPESFDHERFAKVNEKRHTPFAHLPFGAGPRGCIGGNYAVLQILMILSVLLRKYDFRLVPGQTIEARPMVILRPEHGIRMNFTESFPRGAGRLRTPEGDRLYVP